MTVQAGQSSPDIDEFLAELDAVEGSELPGGSPDSSGQQAPDAAEAERKRNEAFKKMRQQLALAGQIIKDMKDTTGGSPPAPPAAGPAVPDEQKANLILQNLQSRAMQNLGLANPQHPLVHMEVVRLYQEDVAQLSKLKNADSLVEKAFGVVRAEFPDLDEADWAAVKKDLKGLDVTKQMEPDVIRGEVFKYRGKNLSKFSGSGSPSAAAPSSARGVSPSVPGSVVQARAGVAPAPHTPSPASVSPATVDEAKTMRRLGLDSSNLADVALFRRSAQKKSLYQG